MSTPNKHASYSSIDANDVAMASLAGSYVQSKLPAAMSYSKEKLLDLHKLAEEGEYSWRVLGFIAGILLMVTSFFGFLADIFEFSPFSALLEVYLFAFGCIAALLEYKELIFTDSWLRVIKREALFLYKPYGRAGFYFFVGILEVVKGGVLGFAIGIYIAFIGAVIYRGSRRANRALEEMRMQGKFTEADLIRKFSEFDRDGSGQLDAKELGNLCASLGYNLTRNEIESALFILDGNRSGKISLDEFKYWWSCKEEPV